MGDGLHSFQLHLDGVANLSSESLAVIRELGEQNSALLFSFIVWAIEVQCKSLLAESGSEVAVTKSDRQLLEDMNATLLDIKRGLAEGVVLESSPTRGFTETLSEKDKAVFESVKKVSSAPRKNKNLDKIKAINRGLSGERG